MLSRHIASIDGGFGGGEGQDILVRVVDQTICAPLGAVQIPAES
jgi:hypothetical protein